MARFIERSVGNLFTQVDPTEPFEYLTCVGVGNVTIPKRASTSKYEPDPMSSGDFIPVGSIRGDIGRVTATLTRPLSTVNNFLIEQDCEFNSRINWPCLGVDRTVVENYDVAYLFFRGEFNSAEMEQPAVIEPSEDERIMTNGELGSLLGQFIYRLVSERQTLSTTTGANDIAFLPDKCANRCGDRVQVGEIGYAVLDTAGYSPAGDSVVRTEDSGGTWAATATDPFNGTRDVLSLLLIDIGNDGHRVVVTGGPDPGQDGEISYSEDDGATWNNVTVGTVNNQGINMITRDQRGRVWVCADAGYVYRSNALVTSWTTQEAGVETAQDLNDIVFYNEQVGYAVGDSNAMIRTTDGDTFGLITGPAVGSDLNSVAVNYLGYVFVTASNGAIYMSTDQGDNWSTLVAAGVYGTDARRIRFDQRLRYFAGLIVDDGSPLGSFYRSEDGGASFREWEVDTNAGLNGVFVADPNMIYICGEPQGGTTFIGVLGRQP